MASKRFEADLSGHHVVIDAKYTCEMKQMFLDADGQKIEVSPEPSVDSMMTVYLDGEQYGKCWDSAFWRLISIPGHESKKIWGIKLGFKSPETCAAYEAFIAALMDEGTTDEVKEYNARKQAKKAAEDADYYRRVVAACERQYGFPDLPTREEAKRRMKQYNDVANEGGEGYVPYVYSREEYEHAKSAIGCTGRGEM